MRREGNVFGKGAGEVKEGGRGGGGGGRRELVEIFYVNTYIH
jgi:hypothetical protein